MDESEDFPEKSEIIFPRTVDLNEAKGLMAFIAENMSVRIGYSSRSKFEGAIRRNSEPVNCFF
ncbi:MAG: hypothetical protein AABX79_00250 [Nanoarchaeota archaeon]